jgi:Transcription factor WhiB
MHTEDSHHNKFLETFAGPAEEVLPDQAIPVLAVLVTPGWWARGHCASSDGDAWFPEEHTKPNHQVTRICTECAVRTCCLTAAILTDEWGIWGGTRRGQRLHARARLLDGDPPGVVLADLLVSPMPTTEYHIPDPVEPVEPIPLPIVTATGGESGGWREAS